jgi:hypothetical protein
MEKSLEAKLQSYHKAIQQEFATIEAAVEKGDPEGLAEAARKTLANNFADYLEALNYLAQGAESEGTQLSALRYILNFLMAEKTGQEDDSINELIKQLQGNATTNEA